MPGPIPVPAPDEAPLLAAEGMKVAFVTRAGPLAAVRGVDLVLRRGETLCLVGESGSGKSTLSMALLRLLPENARVEGRALFAGRDLFACDETALSDIRGRRIGVVLQDPGRSLNPVMTVGSQIAEAMLRHGVAERPGVRARVESLLAGVGIGDAGLRYDQYPHELSGGLKQRVMIAMAMACEPDVVIADEPTTALDVTIQRQVLQLLRRLRAERHLALILVTHDFGVVASMADRVAVMYAGRIVEQADVFSLFHHAAHPYTRALLQASPQRVLEAGGELAPIPGAPPNPYSEPAGCAFAARCPHRHNACADRPALTERKPGHLVACWLGSDV